MSMWPGVRDSTKEEVGAVLPSLREGVVRALASWIVGPLEPFEIHVFGADGDHDVFHSAYHDGTPDLIQAFSLLWNEFLLARTICHIQNEPPPHVLTGSATTHVLHPSLLDESGTSVLRGLGRKPSVALFHLHGQLFPPSLSLSKQDHPCMPVEDVARDLGRLGGRTLLVALPVCFSANLAGDFSTCDGVECVYAPSELDVGENEASFIVRSLSEAIRSIRYSDILGVG